MGVPGKDWRGIRSACDKDTMYTGIKCSKSKMKKKQIPWLKNTGVTGREEVCGRQMSTYHWCKG